jgi:hypothetical protein
VRTYTEEIRAIVRQPFNEDDFQDVSWMLNVPDDLSGIPPLNREDCAVVDTLEGLQGQRHLFLSFFFPAHCKHAEKTTFVGAYSRFGSGAGPCD